MGKLCLTLAYYETHLSPGHSWPQVGHTPRTQPHSLACHPSGLCAFFKEEQRQSGPLVFFAFGFLFSQLPGSIFWKRNVLQPRGSRGKHSAPQAYTLGSLIELSMGTWRGLSLGRECSLVHLGDLGTQYHASVVALMVSDQLIGSVRTSAKCRWAWVKLTLQFFEQSGILGKAIKTSAVLWPGIWKSWVEVLSPLCWAFGSLKSAFHVRRSRRLLSLTPNSLVANSFLPLPPTPLLDLRACEE